MGVELLLGLLGGLALFLYGMQMMSNNLEAAAGNKMKQILEKLTTNRFMGILVGAGITALDPVIFSYNSYDSRLCKLRSYVFKPGCVDHYGC